MNLSNYFWYFTNVIPHRICDDIINYAKYKKETLGRTGGAGSTKELTKKELDDLKKIRNSNVVWMNDAWIYKEIHPFVNLANRNAGWNFDWDYSEDCQFTIYRKNQYYDWHQDADNKPYKNGKIRKLSVTVSLSDPKEYKGGELEFDFKNRKPSRDRPYSCAEILPKGSLVVFPSFVWHRVKPVFEGERFSLVIWSCGNPLR